jgi:hypothetical protein
MNKEQIILTLEEIQVQIKHLHWQTKSIAEHEAYGKIYDSLTDSIDLFVEICMGKHGRPDFTGGYQLTGKDISETDVDEFLQRVCEFLISFSDVYDPQKDSDLLNIRDEILGEFNKLKYLLTLS